MQVFDPSRAYNAFTAGAQLGGAMRQQETERMAAPAISAGNYGQAAEIYGQRGDVAGAAGYRQMYEQQLAQMDEQQKAQARERNNTFGRAAISVRQVPYEQRKQVLMQQAPVLSQMGIDTEMLAQFDPTDEAIDGIMFQIMEIDQLLKLPEYFAPTEVVGPDGKPQLAQFSKTGADPRMAGVAPYQKPETVEQWEEFTPPGGMPGLFQRNATTGEIKRVAAPPSSGIRIGPDGSVQIGGPVEGLGYGSAPKGQEAAVAFDREGNPIVTPGPQQEAYNKAVRGFEEFKAQNSIVVQDIDRALGAISGWSTGAGAALKNLPIVGGITPAGQLESLMSTIQANVGFDKLQAMREASPTGGALGSVTEKELAFLQSVFGSLRQDTSAENVRFNLERLKTHMQGREARIQAALEADFPSLATIAQRRGAVNAQIQALSAEEEAELQALRAELGMQ